MADAVTTPYGLTLVEVGASDGTWGTKLNANFTALDNLLDGTTGITPNLLTGWEIGGVAVTSTAAELNVLDGITATVTELNYMDGVTSAVQTQLNAINAAKQDLITGAISPGVSTNFIPNRALVTGPDGKLLTVGVNSTEVLYLSGVTSSIQTQLDGKRSNTAGLPTGYRSAAQTITAAGSLSLTHGLGAIPVLVQARIRCTSAELGYAVNDEVIVNNGESAFSTVSAGHSLTVSSTTIGVRFANDPSTYQIVNKTTGAANGIDNAKWQLIIRAWV
jgi:hypothetical protein